RFSTSANRLPRSAPVGFISRAVSAASIPSMAFTDPSRRTVVEASPAVARNSRRDGDSSFMIVPLIPLPAPRYCAPHDPVTENPSAIASIMTPLEENNQGRGTCNRLNRWQECRRVWRPRIHQRGDSPDACPETDGGTEMPKPQGGRAPGAGTAQPGGPEAQAT